MWDREIDRNGLWLSRMRMDCNLDMKRVGEVSDFIVDRGYFFIFSPELGYRFVWWDMLLSYIEFINHF